MERESAVRYRKRSRTATQESLFPSTPAHHHFPATRYQGSKLKLLEWIWASIEHLHFDATLDLFGGTCCVAYLLKCKGKKVTVNDFLRSNFTIGKALIENGQCRLGNDTVSSLLNQAPPAPSPGFIERTFGDVFFLPDENRWLDRVAQNVARLPDSYERAIAYFALFQSCLAKRPYNLFHRANLYMRTSDVKRSFGNKATWDKPFEEHFRQVVAEANAAVFDNARDNLAIRGDALDAPQGADLVYMDPPYMNDKGVGVDYLDFYHFLEGLAEYKAWPNRITTQYKHKPYARVRSPWTGAKTIVKAFDDVFARFRDSILVVSYRDNGIPTPEEIAKLLRRHGKRVHLANNTHYRYVLSPKKSRELLFIAE